MRMAVLSPLERLLWIRDRASSVTGVQQTVDKLLLGYLEYLSFAKQRKIEDRFRDRRFRSLRSREGQGFGDGMFQLASLLGKGNPLYRWLVV
jgi:hypothetical protein